MNIQTGRQLDSAMTHAEGGLFAGVQTDTGPLIDVFATIPANPPRLAARAQARRAHEASWTVLAIAAVMMAAGVAAASQVSGTVPAVPAAPAVMAAPRPAAAVAPIAPAAPSLPAAPPSAPEPAPPEASPIMGPALGGPVLAARPAAPTDAEGLELPAAAPQPSGLEVLGAADTRFDAAAAAVAIAVAARGAGDCLAADDATTTMGARVTFAPTGHAILATVTAGPLLGAAVGGCVARVLRGASVRPFGGGAVTVGASIRVR